MNLQSLRGSVAIAAALMTSAACGDTAKAPNYTNAGVIRAPDNAAILDGDPVKGSGFLTFRFRARGPGQPAGVEIEGISLFATHPRMWRTGGSTDACYRHSNWRAATINQFTVTLMV